MWMCQMASDDYISGICILLNTNVFGGFFCFCFFIIDKLYLFSSFFIHKMQLNMVSNKKLHAPSATH